MTPGEYLDELYDALNLLRVDLVDDIIETLDVARHFGRLILVAGNGGSASTADHIACDLARNAGEPVRIVSLSGNAAIVTACGNDDSFTNIYASQVGALGSHDDVLLVVSARGQSPNILAAIHEARRKGMKVAALLGFDGGQVLDQADVALVVHSDSYGVVEDVHLTVGHMITEALR